MISNFYLRDNNIFNIILSKSVLKLDVLHVLGILSLPGWGCVM